jgi:hypothetical protein
MSCRADKRKVKIPTLTSKGTTLGWGTGFLSNLAPGAGDCYVRRQSCYGAV